MVETQDPALSHDGERSPEEIKSDIERTRARLDGTIDELEQRLSPSHFVDEALTRARYGARQGSAAAVEAVRSNPVPLALVAAGLAWWVVDAIRSSGSEPLVDASTGLAAAPPRAAVPTCRQRAEAARRDRELADGGLSARMAGTRQRFWELMDDRPLAAGAAATGVGLLAGVVLPKTRWERERLGPWRDAALDRAGQAAREAAEAATEAARQEAAREDLTASQLGRKARHVADESVSAAAEAARRRLGGQPS